jgi:hypothetical protein
MLVVDGDIEQITRHLWETSDSIPEGTMRDFTLKTCDKCYLDPGGMLHTKIPYRDIEINGHVFCIQLSKAEVFLDLFKRADERVPGFMRFPIWNGWTSALVYASVGVFQALRNELSQIVRTDEAIHANLTDNIARDDIINAGKVVPALPFIILDLDKEDEKNEDPPAME